MVLGKELEQTEEEEVANLLEPQGEVEGNKYKYKYISQGLLRSYPYKSLVVLVWSHRQP